MSEQNPSDLMREMLRQIPVALLHLRKAYLRKIVSSISDPPDGILIVENNRIPVHKMDFFKTMFQSKFKEGNEAEIVLEDVSYGGMLELLSVIYPLSASITDTNIEAILELADCYIMPAVLKRCKKKLRMPTINGAQKLLLAQQYNFSDLQLVLEFARQYETVEDVKKLKSEREYSQLDSNTLALLFNNIAS